MSTRPEEGGRRAGAAPGSTRRRLGGDVLLAALLPLLCAGGLLLVQPERDARVDHPPLTSPLTSASVVCPGALEGSGTDVLGVTTLAGGTQGKVAGSVDVGLGEVTADTQVRTGRVTDVQPGAGPAVVSGADDLAPGLVAGRSTDAPLAAVDCAPTRADLWFTAAGAGATHDSVIELVNPNAGRAVADLTVSSSGGLLEVPALRGVSVPGGTTTRLDLGQIVPHRGDLSVEVHTSRGRLAAHLVDTVDELGTGTRTSDWLAPQTAPATSNLLLGLVTGAGKRALVLANGGDDEVRATIKIVTPTATFAPSGVDPVRVEPGSTEAVSLDDVLQQAAEQGATGLLVESTGPVTATLRQVVAGDLSLLAPADAVASATGVVVPVGAKRLLLAGPDAVGAATVEAFAANGKKLLTQRVELVPDAGAEVAVPDAAVLVTLLPERTTVRAAVVVQGTGAAVVVLRELVLTGLVPDVRTGLP